ncbi:DUF3108 domain-containing protein [Dyella sp. A6]|uniref:DUF3108 domain-containing protein n=1 Tax=Dyella aluminiiresistens TaxID=3069105 RepID=UPI002E7A3A8F|nr:DUF3108 domain-containing protein [Dyella sp. A6]
MSTFQRHLTLAAGFALAFAGTAAHAATPPQAFTATYQVLSDGNPIGQATISLKPVGNGDYAYSNEMKGTSGFAAMIGASSSEASRFRWSHDAAEALTYDYRMDTAFKQIHRHMQVDWNRHTVQVTENRRHFRYAPAPGMVDRNILPLAIGLALQDGGRSVSLPVGVRQRVERQTYQVKGNAAVQVPAGHFQAERVERSDSSNAFAAWYVPSKYPMPVKLAQKGGGDLTLQLVSFRRP